MKYKKYIIIMMLIALTFLLTACAKPIAEVKKDSMVGEFVTVKGTTSNSIKIGPLSGYTLTDEAGDSISVSSKSLPEDGKEMSVKGKVESNLLLGIYLNADAEE